MGGYIYLVIAVAILSRVDSIHCVILPVSLVFSWTLTRLIWALWALSTVTYVEDLHNLRLGIWSGQRRRRTDNPSVINLIFRLPTCAAIYARKFCTSSAIVKPHRSFWVHNFTLEHLCWPPRLSNFLSLPVNSSRTCVHISAATLMLATDICRSPRASRCSIWCKARLRPCSSIMSSWYSDRAEVRRIVIISLIRLPVAMKSPTAKPNDITIDGKEYIVIA